jgi:predicted thioesterase
MEHAAVIAVSDYLEPGETTIFVNVEFSQEFSIGSFI